MNIQVKVPGKLIIIGEYAVLEGANALVAAVDRYAIAQIGPSPKNKICQITSNLYRSPLLFTFNPHRKIQSVGLLDDTVLSSMKFVIEAIEHVCNEIIRIDSNLFSFHLHLDTSQFYSPGNKIKLGLGSSAALTVAIIMALVIYYADKGSWFGDLKEIFRTAFKIHLNVQQNRGSGIDIAAGVFGGVTVYNIRFLEDKNSYPRKVNSNLLEESYMLPIWTGISASTSELLLLIENYKKERSAHYNDVLAELKKISELGCLAYINNDKSNFLESVEHYFSILNKFSQVSKIHIISDVHQNIANTVYKAGGMYKPSGAGSGDFGLAFFESPGDRRTAESLLKKSGFDYIQLGIESGSVDKINRLDF